MLFFSTTLSDTLHTCFWIVSQSFLECDLVSLHVKSCRRQVVLTMTLKTMLTNSSTIGFNIRIGAK